MYIRCDEFPEKAIVIKHNLITLIKSKQTFLRHLSTSASYYRTASKAIISFALHTHTELLVSYSSLAHQLSTRCTPATNQQPAAAYQRPISIQWCHTNNQSASSIVACHTSHTSCTSVAHEPSCTPVANQRSVRSQQSHHYPISIEHALSLEYKISL